MAHYTDLTEYCYGHGTYDVPGTVNVGWLGASTDYDQMEPDEGLFDLVWDYCKISVAQYRESTTANTVTHAALILVSGMARCCNSGRLRYAYLMGAAQSTRPQI